VRNVWKVLMSAGVVVLLGINAQALSARNGNPCTLDTSGEEPVCLDTGCAGICGTVTGQSCICFF
jgi:hypothetical protein